MRLINWLLKRDDGQSWSDWRREMRDGFRVLCSRRFWRAFVDYYSPQAMEQRIKRHYQTVDAASIATGTGPETNWDHAVDPGNPSRTLCGVRISADWRREELPISQINCKFCAGELAKGTS